MNTREGSPPNVAMFAFKIAYDEDYSAYSPGKLVEFEFLERLLSDPATCWADSCAAADYAGPLTKLWADLFLALPRVFTPNTAKSVPMFWKTSDLVRR